MTSPVADHYRRLVDMYAAAPINSLVTPTLAIDDGEARVEWAVTPQQHHAAGAAHGAVVFTALDDAAFFAAHAAGADPGASAPAATR